MMRRLQRSLTIFCFLIQNKVWYQNQEYNENEEQFVIHL